VSYRGQRVLRRAHAPILNVRYDGNACGPFRAGRTRRAALWRTATR
jgi:hypothetical protein